MDIRQEQEKEARKMMTSEGEGFKHGPARRRITVNNAGKLKSKAKQSGHDAFIKMLIDKAVPVEIYTLTELCIKGVIKHADKFSVSVLDVKGKTRVIFKHAIEMFGPQGELETQE